MSLPASEMTRLIFHTLGWPIGTGSYVPTPSELEGVVEYAFKNRVGLLLLERCLERGVDLGKKATVMHESLRDRRLATNAVVVRLARRLDEVAKGEWVLFKSIKPFASTPNDTDWFPMDPSRHGELCDYLVATGDFLFFEKAPRQTTLIEKGGRDHASTTKRGGIYYIDCYSVPSTDYFVYLDQRRLRNEMSSSTVDGYRVPVLTAPAELAATMFHNVFPERSFSIESYYLIKCYLAEIASEGRGADFVRLCRSQRMELAASCNLWLTRKIDREVFGADPDAEANCIEEALGRSVTISGFDPVGRFPYEIPNRWFWRVFLSKQRDPTSLKSSLVQAAHMANPVFLSDVLRVLWRRCVRGGVYAQN